MLHILNRLDNFTIPGGIGIAINWKGRIKSTQIRTENRKVEASYFTIKLYSLMGIFYTKPLKYAHYLLV